MDDEKVCHCERVELVLGGKRRNPVIFRRVLKFTGSRLHPSLTASPVSLAMTLYFLSLFQ